MCLNPSVDLLPSIVEQHIHRVNQWSSTMASRSQDIKIPRYQWALFHCTSRSQYRVGSQVLFDAFQQATSLSASGFDKLNWSTMKAWVYKLAWVAYHYAPIRRAGLHTVIKGWQREKRKRVQSRNELDPGTITFTDCIHRHRYIVCFFTLQEQRPLQVSEVNQ